jgi:hypothetical protein
MIGLVADRKRAGQRNGIRTMSMQQFYAHQADHLSQNPKQPTKGR